MNIISLLQEEWAKEYRTEFAEINGTESNEKIWGETWHDIWSIDKFFLQFTPNALVERELVHEQEFYHLNEIQRTRSRKCCNGSVLTTILKRSN